MSISLVADLVTEPDAASLEREWDSPRPVAEDFSDFTTRPHLSGLRWMDALISIRRRVLRGSTLVVSGQPLAYLYVIVAGSLKAVIPGEDGTEQITGFFADGDIAGLDAIDTGRHVSSFVVIEDAELFAIRFVDLEEALGHDRLVQRQFCKIMSREIGREQAIMVLLGTMGAEQRLATFLLGLARRSALRGLSSTALVLRMSRAEIGSYLGVTVETVSRCFGQLKQRNLLRVYFRSIKILDFDGLDAVARNRL